VEDDLGLLSSECILKLVTEDGLEWDTLSELMWALGWSGGLDLNDKFT